VTAAGVSSSSGSWIKDSSYQRDMGKDVTTTRWKLLIASPISIPAQQKPFPRWRFAIRQYHSNPLRFATLGIVHSTPIGVDGVAGVSAGEGGKLE
jgi:hypothetical protein